MCTSEESPVKDDEIDRELMWEFEELLERMQTPEATAAVDALFEMTPEELGRAAVHAARSEKGPAVDNED